MGGLRQSIGIAQGKGVFRGKFLEWTPPISQNSSIYKGYYNKNPKTNL
jgi:hypothetical protein